MSFAETLSHNDGRVLDQQKPVGEGLSGIALDLLKGADNVIDKGSEAASAGLAAMFGELTLVNQTKTSGDLGVNLRPDVEQVLKDIGVTHVGKHGDHVSMSLRNATEKQYDGAPKVWFDKNVSADVHMSNNRIELKNIKGLMAQALGPAWANVQKAVFQNVDGKCVATITGGRLGISKDIKIDLPIEIYDRLQQGLKANGF